MPRRSLALRELLKKKLHLVLGHKSFADMLTVRQILSPTQAKKLISIAESMPRATALVQWFVSVEMIVEAA